jgi:hypothetical protein
MISSMPLLRVLGLSLGRATTHDRDRTDQAAMTARRFPPWSASCAITAASRKTVAMSGRLRRLGYQRPPFMAATRREDLEPAGLQLLREPACAAM